MTDAPYEVTIPQETVNDETVRILSWKAACGSLVTKDQVICEIETSKVVVDMHAPVGGLLDYRLAAGDEVAVGTTLCSIMPESTGPIVGVSNYQDPIVGVNASGPAPVAATGSLPPTRLTPSARRAAAEHKVEISAFPPGSLVRKSDVLRMAGFEIDDEDPLPTERRRNGGIPDRSEPCARLATAVGVPVEWRALPRKKVNEGKILEAGKASTVQSSVTCRVKAPLLRVRLKDLYGSDVAFDALILFECGRLLIKYPELNAVHDNGRIGEYRRVNICWAIDSGRNLVAPVVQQCDQKPLGEIVAAMEYQLERYLDNSLGLDDLAGGTFTVSDLSTDGICFFNPLITQGQGAILGVSSDTTAAGEEMLYLTLAFDHHLAEGRLAAQFLKELAFRLEAHSTVQALKTEPTTAVHPLSAEAAYCVVCQRNYAHLLRSRAILLKSEIPPGLVCSLCVGGF